MQRKRLFRLPVWTEEALLLRMERDSCEEAVLIEGAEIFLRRVDDGAVAVLA